jgi:acetylornithine deacetylase/succinyl-diaminopimelate desuccinylase-like protein
VVPANAADWKVDPFSGEIFDDCVWGRGAVDMKDMDAMVLAVVRRRLRSGRLPARPVVLAFTADEEAGSALGAHWLVDHRPELFEGCTEGISEVGGFSVTLDNDRRIYLVQAAEKGIDWLRLTALGTAGHGSMIQRDNAVSKLALAVTRLGTHEWPFRLTSTVRTLLTQLAEVLEVDLDLDDADAVRALVNRLGPISRMIGATLSHTLNPTMLEAGYKANVVPGEASATVDGRFLPGGAEDFAATVDALLPPGVRRESIHSDIAVEEPWAQQIGTGGLVDTMIGCLTAADPQAAVLPYTMSGGTDGKAFSRLGISSYGFAPLQLPPGLDFSGMFHGIDERVPIDGLRFGVGVLDTFLDRA